MGKKGTIAALATSSLVLGAISGVHATESEINYRALGTGDDVRAQVLDGDFENTIAARGGYQRRAMRGSGGERGRRENKCGRNGKVRRRNGRTMVMSNDKVGEGSCGEGKCGGGSADIHGARKRLQEGACGEGTCGSDVKDTHVKKKKMQEGTCGEGKCGG